MDEWTPCPSCDCGLDCRPIREFDGKFLVCCPMDPKLDEELTPDDLLQFRIHVERLIEIVAQGSDVSGPVERIANGLWCVGRLPSGRTIAVALKAWVLKHPGTILLLKAAACGSPMTLVSPDPGCAVRRRLVEAGINFMELLRALKPRCDGADILDGAVLEPAPAAPQLVIERRARRVTFGDRDIRLSRQSFRLFLYLCERALQGPAIVSVRDIEDHVWGSGIHRIASSVRDPIRALRAGLTANAATADGLIEYRRNPNGYRLALSAKDIVILE